MGDDYYNNDYYCNFTREYLSSFLSDDDPIEDLYNQTVLTKSFSEGLKKVISKRFEQLYNQDTDDDITIDDFYVDDIGDGDVWVTKDYIAIEWSAITDSHLDKIISSIERGRELYGQGWKIDRAREEKFNRTLKNYV